MGCGHTETAGPAARRLPRESCYQKPDFVTATLWQFAIFIVAKRIAGIAEIDLLVVLDFDAAGGDYHGTLEEAAEYFRNILKDNKEKYLS